MTPQHSRQRAIEQSADFWNVHFCRVVFCAVLALAAFMSAGAHAALSKQDLDTQSLERMVADDPRAALRESATWQQQAMKSGDRKLELRALRMAAMAHAGMEESSLLAKVSEQGLPLARALHDKQAECEFMAGNAVARSEAGEYVASLAEFDAAIAVAEKAGLARAATNVMISKAFVYGLLGRHTEALDLTLMAHQRFVDAGDEIGARTSFGAIGNAYTHEHASNEDLLKALHYHQQAIPPEAERHSRHELAAQYFNIGHAYQRLKDWANAALYMQKSIALHRMLKDDVGVAYCDYRLGVIAGEAGQWRDALSRLDQALPPVTGVGDVTMIFHIQSSRALALANLDRRRESLEALAEAEALRGRIQSRLIEKDYLGTAKDVYAKLGDFENAFRHQALLIEAEKRNADIEREKAIAEVQARFEVKQKETENALLRARESASNARNLALGLALVVLLIVLAALCLFLRRQSQQKERFANLALWDDLTGLPNRRGILQFAEEQLAKSRSERSPMWLALIDIDNFKLLNDQFGHAAGDAVLATFARHCTQRLRGAQKIGRYGGEEFLLVMPGSDLNLAPQLFAQLREANQPAPHNKHPFTFSMGAVNVADTEDNLEKLISRADEAMYCAKHDGRDRFELADDKSPAEAFSA